MALGKNLLTTCFQTMNNSHIQLWSKFLKLICPVVNQTRRSENQNPTFFCHLTSQKSNGLKGFPKSHIISQNPTKTIMMEHLQPANSLFLIISQVSLDLSCLQRKVLWMRQILGQILEFL
ncbi:Uncharacterised protein [Streptococcus pneumoniae]|nr:Uncharacterised protein [Streptococcus pneumoniae]